MSHRRRLRFALASFCGGMVLINLTIWWLARRQVAEGLPDLRIFYTAGLILRSGQGHSLYDDALQYRTQSEFVALRPGIDRHMPYNHPPFEAIFYLPLTYLPFVDGYAVWILVNGVLLGISLYVMRPWIRAVTAEFPELLWLAPPAYFPVMYAFMQAQDSILMLMLYSLAYAAFRRNRDLQGGVWLGIGLFKFQLVLPFALVLVLLRRWRAIGGLALSAACEFAISLTMVGWRELLEYPRYAWQVNRAQAKGVIIPSQMANLRGLIVGWGETGALRSGLEILLFAVSLCLLLWAARQWKPWDLSHPDHWNTGFCIALVSTYLVGYHGYNQDLSMLLLPLALTFNRVLRSDSSSVNRALRIIVALFFVSPLYLILTLRLEQQHVFAIVIVGFVLLLYISSRGGAPAFARASPGWMEPD